MVFNATFNISVILWWSVLLVEETGVPRENQNRRTENGQKKDYKTQAIVHKHYTEI
jgi:hypothetical protein